MELFYKIILVLLIIGGINWGLIGLFDFNLVTFLFGINSLLTSAIYIIVGISSILSCGILFNRIENK